MKHVFSFLFLIGFNFLFAQQQQVNYTIDADMDVKKHIVSGTQKIEYINNSNDELSHFYLHLYWNAFQPKSSMDLMSRSIADPDKRVANRIAQLNKDEMGFMKIKSIKINGSEQKSIIHETILEIILDSVIKPNSTTYIELKFEAQVPLQIRRSGRNNQEGIMYSMAQWYPKVCGYDARGWHPNQYIAREFYGEFGNFDVSITIDKNFVVAASGYEDSLIKKQAKTYFTTDTETKKTWHFTASKIHDFVWAADTGYIKVVKKVLNEDLNFYFYYKPTDKDALLKWQLLEDKMVAAYPLIKNLFGSYEYKKYSFIQGGDGGMEYGMATLIKNSNVETAIHEFIHSWFQGMLANNESDFAWMDEGFTSYAENRISRELENEKNILLKNAYRIYISFINFSSNEQPMNTPSDFFLSNANYSVGSYIKGALLLQQLAYLVGDTTRDNILKEYVKRYKFKHPQPNDFFKTAEDVSKLQLKWFQNLWVNAPNKIDYGIAKVINGTDTQAIILECKQNTPMPIQLKVTFKNDSVSNFYIPTNLTLGNKIEGMETYQILTPWNWIEKQYVVKINSVENIDKVEIQDAIKMVDINLQNNTYKVPQ